MQMMPRGWWIPLLGLAGFAAETSWIARYAEESSAAKRACDAREATVCREHLTTLLDLLDGRADIVYRLAKAETMAGNTQAAMTWLTRFSQMGLPFVDPAADPDFSGLRARPEFRDAMERLEAARAPVTHSRVLFTVPEKDLVVEDVAYDPADGRFYLSSVRHRKIVSLGRDGRTADFLREGTPDIWALLALGVDARRRCLWATTSAMPEALGLRAEDRGRSALLRFSLPTGELLKRYDMPRDAEHSLGDLTVAPDGDVFVSDSRGGVYRVDHRRDRLEPLVAEGVFRSPQTPALSGDGRKLLVPDYSRGLSSVDLASGEVRRVGHPPDLSLAGIDGFYLSGRTALAVQNGTAPKRILRLRLNADLAAVESWETVEANWNGLGDPTHGVVVGGHFDFIANSGWDRLADDGALKPGAVFEPATIRELTLKR